VLSSLRRTVTQHGQSELLNVNSTTYLLPVAFIERISNDSSYHPARYFQLDNQVYAKHRIRHKDSRNKRCGLDTGFRD
jgi:hypothetical protein